MQGPSGHYLLACGPCVVIVNCWDRFCTFGRAPRTKETLLDFREWCRVTRHPRVFRRLTGCQRDTLVLGLRTFRPNHLSSPYIFLIFFFFITSFNTWINVSHLFQVHHMAHAMCHSPRVPCGIHMIMSCVIDT